jgi:pimeloyl-ACP methyl ester carboxylesterase
MQQASTLALLAAAAAWAIVEAVRGHPLSAVLGSFIILFGYAAFLAVEFVMLRLANRLDPAPQAHARHLVKAWLGEVVFGPRVFCWWQPFRWKAVPDYLPAESGQRGVVLVHGFVCNRGFWHPLKRKLQKRGIPFVAVNLEPVFGSIDDYAPLIESAVRRLQAATGSSPLVVAHSMGGLAVRAWMRAAAGQACFHKVITVGSPHHGTILARFAFSDNGRQMARSSEWLEQLRRSEAEHAFRRFICFYSHCDNVVFPASTACLPGAENRHVPGRAHVHMAHDAEVTRSILAELQGGRG